MIKQTTPLIPLLNQGGVPSLRGGVVISQIQWLAFREWLLLLFRLDI